VTWQLIIDIDTNCIMLLTNVKRQQYFFLLLSGKNVSIVISLNTIILPNDAREDLIYIFCEGNEKTDIYPLGL